MEAVYLIKDNTYTVSLCTTKDIYSDYEIVRELVSDTPEDLYKDLMLKSVECELAYRVTDSNGKLGFMYTYIEKCVGYGSAIYSNIPVIGFVCLLKELFNEYPSHKILMVPHRGNIAYLKSMVTGCSLRECHNNENEYLVVKLKDMRVKFKELYFKLGGK